MKFSLSLFCHMRKTLSVGANQLNDNRFRDQLNHEVTAPSESFLAADLA